MFFLLKKDFFIMLLPIGITFFIAFVLLFWGKYLAVKFYKIISLLPFSLFLYFASKIPKIQAGDKGIYFSYEWMPSLGVNLNFTIDGLSLLFNLLITGIGSLVFLYASYYMKKEVLAPRFFGFLTAFMGAMIGVVSADNLIMLFIFWELTSITSFFLIGYNTTDEKSRKNALWALSITGFGGFFLLASFVLMSVITDSYSIRELFFQSTTLIHHSWYYVLIVFLFLGAFTKSAQFPFHFWLPGAMQAPTPVSSYLHSATMVKAGIYLLARFSPILSDQYIWNIVLIIIGGITMVMGAFYSIFKIDMKSILAYTTISALGILVFLLGIGTEKSLFAAVVFVLVHALYKATLFMSTGIVDHAVHSRNILEIRGLRRKMPIVAFATFIAVLSSAGIPLTFGFVGKELMYEAVYSIDNQWAFLSIPLLVILIATSIFLSTSGFLAGVKPFFGKMSEKIEKFEKPNYKLWLPVVVLAIFSLFFGLFPHWADSLILHAAANSVVGLKVSQELHVWHGWNIIVMLSILTIVCGVGLYLFLKPSEQKESFSNSLQSISPQTIILRLAQAIKILALRYTQFFHNGYLRVYIMNIILFFIIIVGYKLFRDVPLQLNLDELSDFRFYEVLLVVLIIVSVVVVTIAKSRLTSIGALGVLGYAICILFVVYGAPDLAMTQFAIDTLTVVLFVLVLSKLPAYLRLSNTRIKRRDALIAIAFGILISIITMQALLYSSNKEVSKFYADNAYLLAKGKNVVNVILVDYRGIDTLIETIVLAIAAMGVYSILKYKTKDGEKNTEY